MPDLHAVRVFLDDHHLALDEAVARFCRSSLAPLPRPETDQAARAQAREILAALGKAGLLEPIAAQDLRACAVIREGLAAASPLADAVFALQALGATPIQLAGSAEQRDAWIQGVVAGKTMTAFAMTEPDAGSDVAALATTAVRTDGGYTLDGTKTLISNAGIADCYTVFAVTDESLGKRGISCFVVAADTPGLEFTKPLVMSEPHPLGEIAFRACRVPDSALLGERNRGYALGLATLDRLRATVAAAACGMAARALDEALRHARTRHQFGQPIASFQLVQQKLARMATDLAAGRLLTYHAAWEKDTGAERVTVESAMAKAFATEAAQRIVDDAVQILGGRGVLADHPVDRLYRAVRALRIYEGTTEVQHLVIAGGLVKDARSP